MAFEISEGAAAGAMWIPYNKLSKLNLDDDTEIWNAMVAIWNNLSDSSRVVGGDSEKRAYMEWMDPANKWGQKVNGKTWDARVTAVIHGYSSALAAKNWMQAHGEKQLNLSASDRVYLTGGAWDNKIAWLKVTVNKWSDYNSSDLVITRGHCYYGVSLKKKDAASSADPPMINKSIMELLKSVSDSPNKQANRDIKNIMEELRDTKSEFFGNIVLEAKKGPLKGTTGLGNNSTTAFQTQIRHADPKKSPPWISLIDLKGSASISLATGVTAVERKDKESGENIKTYRHYIKEVAGGKIICSSTDPHLTESKTRKLLAEDSIQKLFGLGQYSQENKWAMRKYVNATLGAQNDFYDIIYKILNNNNVAKTIGWILLTSVLKVELKEAINESNIESNGNKKIIKKCENCHFGFSLITAVGKFDKGKMRGVISAGNVKENPTIQGVLSMLSPNSTGVSRDKWVIKKGMHESGIPMTEFKRNQASDKGEEPPAKLFFTIGINGASKKFHPVLDLEVRYKGTFAPWPQFLGGLTPYFITLLHNYETANPRRAIAAKDCGA